MNHDQGKGSDMLLEVQASSDEVVYLFLALAADRHGVSFYRKEKICDFVGLDWTEFEVARRRLVELSLIAFQPYRASNPNGYYQVLPVDGRPPAWNHAFVDATASTPA